MNKNRNFELTGAPEDSGEDFEAAAFAALLEDMAGKARFLAEALDILAEIGMEPDNPGCEPGPAEDMEAESETDLYLISGGSFRLLVGSLHDLFVRHFSLEKRLGGGGNGKGFQKNPEERLRV